MWRIGVRLEVGAHGLELGLACAPEFHSSSPARAKQLFWSSGGFFGAALVAAEGGAPAHQLTVGYALGAR